MSNESKSPPAADRTWTPAVGEMCEGICTKASCGPVGMRVTGTYVSHWKEGGQEWVELKSESAVYGDSVAVEVGSLRPASRPSLPEAQFKVGDRVTYITITGKEAPGEVVALGDSMHLVHCDAVGMLLYIEKSKLRQATHPPAHERTTSVNTGSDAPPRVAPSEAQASGHSEPSRPAEAKVDPYAEHDFVHEGPAATEVANRQRRDKRLAALTASPDPLDRLAAARAKRSAHVEAHRKDLDRKVRAPWDWPGVEEFEVTARVVKIGDER